MHRRSASPSVFRLFFILALSLPSLAAAGPVTGRVVDPDGRPVAGARVLVSRAGAPLQTVTTGNDGGFAVDLPDQDRATLRVAADGFRADDVLVEEGRDRRDVGTIRLAVNALSESLVVSASHVEVPLTRVTSTVTVISGAELQARGLHSIGEALRAVPGLTVVSTGGTGATTGVFPRGGESNYTLAIVDGVPVNAFGGDVDFGQISTANVDRIEIVRGPQSALFGAGAIGAVVRIVTRRGGPPSASVMAEGGGYGTGRVTAATAGSRGAVEWGAHFDRLQSDGLNGERLESGAVVANDDYERQGAAAALGWRQGEAYVRGDVRYSTDDRGFPGPFGSNPIGAYAGIDAISRGVNDRSVASAAAALPLTARLRLQMQTGYTRLESDFASPFGASQSFSRRWAGRAQADLRLAPGLDASAGVEVQRERAGSTYITGAVSQEIPIGRTTAGYFAEARWSARDRLFLTAGVRAEDIRRDAIEEAPSMFSPRPLLPADTVVSVNPRASAGWIVRGGATDYTKIRGAGGTGIRAPDAFELAFTDNPGLRPERSISAEVGVDQAFARGVGLLEATAFFNEYDDLIVAVGSFRGSSRFRTDNIANARARGLEVALTLRGRLPVRRAVDLGARFGYTRLDSEVLDVDRAGSAPPPFTAGQPLLRRPRHQFFADLSATSGRLAGFLRGGGRSTALDVEPSYGTFGGLFDSAGYQAWDAGASFRVGRGAEIFGRVENLFDRAYEEAFGFPALGRRAIAGLRIAAGR